MGQRARGRYTYKEFDGVWVFYKPRELTSYRRLLPEVFGMPDAPLVQIFIADYYKMDEATQPYLEAAVSFLRAKGAAASTFVRHTIRLWVECNETRRP